jgi:hypothetical protein
MKALTAAKTTCSKIDWPGRRVKRRSVIVLL